MLLPIAHHPWIFAVLTGLPLIFFAYGLSWPANFEKSVTPVSMPRWVEQIHRASVPVLSASIGFVVAVSLSWITDQRLSLQVSQIAHDYTFWFILFWSPIFLFFNYFYLGMWHDACHQGEKTTDAWIREFLIRGVVARNFLLQLVDTNRRRQLEDLLSCTL
jgi:hypothetical protein